MRARIRAALVTLAATVVLGCASGGTGDPAATPQPGVAGGTVITVENNVPGGSTVTVSIIPQAGVRQSLGQVPGGESRQFTYDGSPGLYRLIAVRDVGGDIESSSFRLYDEGTVVDWSLSTNSVRSSGR